MPERFYCLFCRDFRYSPEALNAHLNVCEKAQQSTAQRRQAAKSEARKV